jgi:preprotein translocase SecE subunit
MSFINAVVNYFKGSYRELGKVSWPSRNETITLTIIVIAVVLVSMVFLMLIDLGLTEVINKLISLKSAA